MHQENMLTPNCSSSRNLLIDFMRGIAICLVVLGHNIQYGSGRNFLVSSDFYNNSVFKLIYSFHMPLFALIAGYVFFGLYEKKVWRFLS